MEEDKSLVPEEREDKEQEKEDEILEEFLPPGFEEVIKDAPPEVKRWMVGSFTSVFRRSPESIMTPLFKKLTEGHIDKFLKITEDNYDRAYKDSQSTRKYRFWYYLVGVGVFIFLVIFLKSNPDMLSKIIEYGVLFGGGFGAGIGLEHWRRRNE